MPPRARRPRGHIEPLPSGSFRAVVFTGIDPLTSRRQYVRETCSSRAEAEKALTRLQGQVDENRHPKSSINVATAMEQWMEVADLEVTTRERYEDLIRLYIVPTFGDLQAGRLDAELLERFYARLHRCKAMCGSRRPRGHVCTPLSTSTIRKIHYVLRGALGRAARWGYVSVNAAELAQAPSPRKPRPDPPSAREAAGDAWTDPEWGLLLWLTMITGLRRGELCALRWRHVDLDRANLRVDRSTAHSRTGMVEKDTKTESQRRLSLDPHTVELLRTHRDTVATQLAVLGVQLDGETYVFSTTPDYSQPHSPKAVTQKYRKMATRLRLRSTRLHALRHYSPTELPAAGVDLRTVSGRLGHSSGVTTLRVYAAWVDQADRRAAEEMAKIMPVVVPKPRPPRGPYESIADVLRDDIVSGRLRPGDELPTVVQLAAHRAAWSARSGRALGRLGCMLARVGLRGLSRAGGAGGAAAGAGDGGRGPAETDRDVLGFQPVPADDPVEPSGT